MSKKVNKRKWIKPDIEKMRCADAEGSMKMFTPYDEREVGNQGLYGPS